MEIITVNNVVKIGVTSPLIIIGSDGINYVMKCVHGHCSPKILLNEFICAKLASLLELPLPNFKIANLSQDTIDSSIELQHLKAIPGKVFCSEYIRGITSLSPLTIDNLKNQEVIPDLVAFDLLIGNSDRATDFKRGNAGNYLVNKKQELLLIDHSHVFINQEIWDKNTLSSAMEIGSTIDENFSERYRYFRRYINGRNPFENFINKCEAIDISVLDDIFYNIPPEWDISSEDIDALKKFIEFQCINIREILNRVQDDFPEWKGGQ